MLIASRKKTGSPICRIIINSIVFICHNSVAQHGGMLHSRHNMRWPFFALLPQSPSLSLLSLSHWPFGIVVGSMLARKLSITCEKAAGTACRSPSMLVLATCNLRDSRLSTREIQFQWKQLNSGKKVSRHANVERSTQSGTMVVPAIIMNWSVRCQSAQTQPENGQCEELAHMQPHPQFSLHLAPFPSSATLSMPVPDVARSHVAQKPNSQAACLPLAPVSCGLRQDTVHAQLQRRLQPRPGTQCCC